MSASFIYYCYCSKSGSHPIKETPWGDHNEFWFQRWRRRKKDLLRLNSSFYRFIRRRRQLFLAQARPSRAGMGRSNLARRPRPEEKLAVNKPNTRYYLAPNHHKHRELFARLDRCTSLKDSVNVKEFQEPDRLELTFLPTWHKTEIKVRNSKKARIPKFLSSKSDSF